MSTEAAAVERAVAAADHHAEVEQRVTPLELFFDLVFVFAFTQVTALMSERPTWAGVGEGMLVLAALWWAWAAYAWLTNSVDADEGGNRLVIFAAMAAMLVVSLATPAAFGGDALVFAAAYMVVRLLHIGLYAQASRDVDLRSAVRALAPTAVLGPALIVVAAVVDGPAQAPLWIAALAIDYAGPALGRGARRWRVSAGHFAERHGLIMIIALGESIVAIGVGAAGLELDAALLAAGLAGIAIAACLWWAYFDVVALVAERRLREARGPAQAAMARDSYSYLHVFMVAGIILSALGIKKALGKLGEPLAAVPAAALYGGVALYLLGHIAFRLRNVGTLNRQRLVTAGVLLGLIPLATRVPALAALALLAGLCCALIAYEAIRFREARARVRAAAH